ncbi:Delta24-sterol reductase [Marchantia polymorpha subsp. ruderalis]|uniref:Delta(24)-sterol reductase n=2 Tax=Marchantia polymorpha TaxID=3197 RepID=A0A176VRE0_MARPO|nr:hypothetical protein AXG93_3544s1030 [Marchantia polymorpha subsp. ruderalis]PTQ27615.1 hypothetical protein MARPO_0190s0010 [Marchantia polymorpha]BBN12448.1 hypothetical protein Mp_5g20140 [Marchantia polymorpha subsp. ruderalis]|eukprot:PTQ27615.1 hypothetical protein MARPO_0190s0010 [Marchantia polymorpha]
MSDLNTPLVKKRKWSWVDWAVQFRWILVITVVLPVSMAFDIWAEWGDWWSARKSEEKRQKEHDKHVEEVIKRLKSRDASKDGLVCTARKPWIAVGMRNVDYKRARHFEVDLSAFRQVLEIDEENMIARCEPLVTMGQITRMTVPMNLSLAVVAELDDLTVGGLINGYGIEGSSHIYGLFSDTVVWYEIVLADGRLVKATRDNEFSDLFYAIPWSQGTLGLLVAAGIKLIRIKEYMKVTYKPVRGTVRELGQAYLDSFIPRDGDQDNPEKVPEFVEGMVYNDHEGVMMTGRYASKEEAKKKGNVINRQRFYFKKWFYQHAQTALKKGEFVEYIPTRDYYHRHTRCLYWEGKLILPFGDQVWFRYLFGWMMPPKVSFLKATQGDAIRNYYHERHIIQDMLIPAYKVPEALEFAHNEFELYPIWLCPHRIFKAPMKTMINPQPGFEYEKRPGDTPYAQMFTDVGLYYTPNAVFRGEEFDGVAAVKKLEQWLIDNKAFQALYAVSELNEQDFWRMFDATLYNKCRDKYRAVGTFMGVYYKSKKGKKSEQEVRDEESKVRETQYADIEKPMSD